MPIQAREKGAAQNAKRRAWRAQSGGLFTAAQIDELFKKQRSRCAWCGVKLNRETLRRDHRTALANGGSNDIRNIEILCNPCNSAKGALDEIEWANKCGRLL